MKKIKLFVLTFLFASAAIAQAPVIISFSPVIATAGQTVTISGIYFNDTIANVTVFFGKIKGTVLTTSFSQITVTVPYGASLAPIGVTVHHLNGISKLNFTPSFAGNSQPLSASNFSAPIRIPYYAQSFFCDKSILLADMDGDGKLDIVTMGQTGSSSAYASQISIYRNINSPGTPLSSTSFAPAFAIPTSTYSEILQIFDFDGDGKLDILFYYQGTATTQSSRILFNTSTPGSLSFSSTYFWFSAFTTTAVADIDGDGKLDIIYGNSTVKLYQNTSYACGAGWCNSYPYPATTLKTLMYSSVGSLALQDITGDFKPELFLCNYRSSPTYSDTTFAFQNMLYGPGTIDSTAFPVSVTFTDIPAYGANYFIDFDGDGQLDWLKFNRVLYSPTYSPASLVFRKNISYGSITNSSFGTPYIDSTNYYNNYYDIDIADLNGDGKPDVAGSIRGYGSAGYGHAIRAITNLTGSGAYSSSSFIDTNLVAFGTGYDFKGSAIGDLDGDSRPDIVYSNNDTAINILRNITPILKPTVQASGVAISLISNTYMNLSWTNGNGAGRIVLAKPVSALTDTPSGYSVYTANSVFGSGSLIGTSTRVVYIGNGNNVTISGLTPGVLYRFAVFEYNGFGTVLNYLTTTSGTGSATTLPVKLISFTAEKQNEDVLLHWQTASEINNDFFIVERSNQPEALPTGQAGNSQWLKAGTVKGHGTTNSVSNYQFLDEMLKQVQHDQTVFYRLKQVDFDGKFEYSKIVSVEFTKKQIPELVVFPNPNSGEFEIKITALTSATTLEIFDVIGNKVHEEILTSSTSKLHLNNLNKGVYFLKITDEKNSIVNIQKVVVMK